VDLARLDCRSPVCISAGILADIHLRWSADAKRIFISVTTSKMSEICGRTDVVPLLPGRMLPQIPAADFRSEEELARLPGVRIIDAADVAPGPTPEVYAYSRETVQRNLYRIPPP
jgi:hypothetical protein